MLHSHRRHFSTGRSFPGIHRCIPPIDDRSAWAGASSRRGEGTRHAHKNRGHARETKVHSGHAGEGKVHGDGMNPGSRAPASDGDSRVVARGKGRIVGVS